MYKLTDKAKEDLIKDLYLINCATARNVLAKDIMQRLKHKRWEVRNAFQNKEKNN